MAYRLDRESREALGAARSWLADNGWRVDFLSNTEVVGDVHRHYEGGWDQFLADQKGH